MLAEVVALLRKALFDRDLAKRTAAVRAFTYLILQELRESEHRQAQEGSHQVCEQSTASLRCQTTPVSRLGACAGVGVGLPPLSASSPMLFS